MSRLPRLLYLPGLHNLHAPPPSCRKTLSALLSYRSSYVLSSAVGGAGRVESAALYAHFSSSSHAQLGGELRMKRQTSDHELLHFFMVAVLCWHLVTTTRVEAQAQAQIEEIAKSKVDEDASGSSADESVSDSQKIAAGCGDRGAPSPTPSASTFAQVIDDDKDELNVRVSLPGLGLVHHLYELITYEPDETPPQYHYPQHNTADSWPPLQWPIVLCHGFLGYSSALSHPITREPAFEYFGDIRKTLENHNYTVIVPVLPRSTKVEERAKALRAALGMQQTAKQHESIATAESVVNDEGGAASAVSKNKIDLNTYQGPFHVIAHSMSGLDARFLISHLQLHGDESENRIASLTTLGSPHHGSPIADLIVKEVQKVHHLPKMDISAGIFTTHVADQQLSHEEESGVALQQIALFLEQKLKIDLKGMLDLTTSATEKFNLNTLDRSGTFYQSYAGYRDFSPLSVWYLPSLLIQKLEGWNDGLVSVQSATWGHFRGVLPLDHLEQVGLGVFSGSADLRKDVFAEIVQSLYELEMGTAAQQHRNLQTRMRKSKLNATNVEQKEQEEQASEDQKQSRENNVPT